MTVEAGLTLGGYVLGGLLVVIFGRWHRAISRKISAIDASVNNVPSNKPKLYKMVEDMSASNDVKFRAINDNLSTGFAQARRDISGLNERMTAQDERITATDERIDRIHGPGS